MTELRFDVLAELERNFRFLKNIPLLPNIIDEYLKVYTLFFQPSIFRQMSEYVKTLKKWEGISTSYHRYGGIEFRVNGIEIGHIHGNGLVDLHLNKTLANYCIQRKLSEPHHVQQSSGWISYYISPKGNLDMLLQLSQIAYQLKAKCESKATLLQRLELIESATYQA